MNSAEIRNLLQQAKNAQMAGNMPEAQRLWLQAHSLDTSLSKPAWVDQLPPPNQGIEDTGDATALLHKAAGLPYGEAKPLLEEWLRRFPLDVAIRNYYLARAKAAEDHRQTERHRAILETDPQADKGIWWKYLLAGVLGILLSWEAREFYRDWKTKRQP